MYRKQNETEPVNYCITTVRICEKLGGYSMYRYIHDSWLYEENNGVFDQDTGNSSQLWISDLVYQKGLRENDGETGWLNGPGV